MKILRVLLICLVGCQQEQRPEKRTNWDYVQSHHCAFEARFGPNYTVMNGERKQSDDARSAFRCDADGMWVEVYDSDLPKGTAPITASSIVQTATPDSKCSNIVAQNANVNCN